MTKSRKIISIIFLTLVVTLGVFAFVWYFGDTYPSFYAQATREFDIPGLSHGFTPQGLCYEESTKLFLLSGYMKDGSESRIYVVHGGIRKHFTLTDGEEGYVGHAGGIATDGTSVWIVGDGIVNRFMFDEVLDVEDGGKIEIIDSFESNNGADFVTVENGNLWVGEFQRNGSYERAEDHIITTKSGLVNKALSFCYEIDETQAHALKSTTPIKALSTCSLVQGMVMTEDKIILSISYSLATSRIITYDNITTSITEDKYNYNGKDIDLYILDVENELSTLKAPCMSEEITIAENRVYILFESACKKYSFVTREALKNVYSFELV